VALPGIKAADAPQVDRVQPAGVTAPKTTTFPESQPAALNGPLIAPRTMSGPPEAPLYRGGIPFNGPDGKPATNLPPAALAVAARQSRPASADDGGKAQKGPAPGEGAPADHDAGGAAKKKHEATVTFSAAIDAGVVYGNTVRRGPLLAPGGQFQLFGGPNLGPRGLFVTDNIAQQSFAGVAGDVPINDHYKLVFNLRENFNPRSFRLSDSAGSLVQANGVPVAEQKARADGTSGRFNGPAYLGVSLLDDRFTVTAGNLSSPSSVVAAKGDPQSGNYAGSLPSYFTSTVNGTPEQGLRRGAFQFAANKFHIDNLPGTFRFSVTYGPGGNGLGHFGPSLDFTGGYTGDVHKGKTILGLSQRQFQVDVDLTHIGRAVGGAPLSGPVPAGFPSRSFAGTISDVTGGVASASETLSSGSNSGRKLTLSALAGTFEFRPPSTPVVAGAKTIGDITLATVNNNPASRDLYLVGGGARYETGGHWTLSTGAYRVWQSGVNLNGDGYLVSGSGRYTFNPQAKGRQYSLGLTVAREGDGGALRVGPPRATVVALDVKVTFGGTKKIALAW
jgi:hypothetical protein